MLRFLQSEYLLISLWLPFLMVAVGGSGLHHAPVFGLHACCGGHQHQQVDSQSHSDCNCPAHSAPQDTDFDIQGHGLTEKSEPCSICKFFASAHASVCDAALIEAEFVSSMEVETRPSVAISFPAGFFARGPPAA